MTRCFQMTSGAPDLRGVTHVLGCGHRPEAAAAQIGIAAAACCNVCPSVHRFEFPIVSLDKKVGLRVHLP
jgi:hypothetical protein